MADIITYPENGITYDADDAAGYLATRLSGVYSAEEDFSVTAQGGLSVQVSAGQAWVRPARFKGRSIIMEQPTTVVLTEADPVRSRIDRIVLRYDAAAKKTSLQVLDGTPDSAAPAAPEISRTELVYDLCLAEIRRPAGSTSVTAADITDTRADETVCGVMRDGVTGIPTAQLQAQVKAMLDSLQAEVDSRSFYTKAEADAEHAKLQEQISSAIAAGAAITASGDGYIRFSDGTQICWNTKSFTSNGGFTPIYTFGFPVPFVDTKYAVAGIKASSSSDGDSFYVSRKSTSSISLFNVYNSHDSGLFSTIIAIGRWK